MRSDGEIKVFCIYYDARPVFRTDALVPIQAGRAITGLSLEMQGDDTGINISRENARYGEMTAWYWVWKNYLPAHPELEHVGFFQYRRFLNMKSGMGQAGSVRTTYSSHLKTFGHWCCSAGLRKAIGDADVCIRQIGDCGHLTLYDHYAAVRPENRKDWQLFTRILFEREPENQAVIERTLAGCRMIKGLQFVMRRELFEDFMGWCFGICREFERRSSWSGEKGEPSSRAPAFIVERMFIVWLNTRQSVRAMKVREFPLVYLSARPWWYPFLKPLSPLLSERAKNSLYERYR